ncbi:EF-hand domain-containing protein [Myxococcus sp. K38C18041901]|uniref:EF-hand domain-containing protein n=1 Tax=Myxococcus guangdongensis TaxID=2906760 RepID=UPI0020A80390|nr:EF-hand domain-containing protein [Myxococcus guangdongensis]MCP3061425.1 EF-hand domain-containing protein [Myxococcus guangdongensis]
MATKKRKSSAAKKSSRRASTTKKAATKKPTARKATAKKSAAKKGAARKSTAKKAATKKRAAKKAATKKSAARKAATRKAPSGGRKSAPATAPLSPRLVVSRDVAQTPPPAVLEEPTAPGLAFVEQVETSSAGILPLAPEHAAVDELTSSGNELLDIFQRYDRNRTGAIERAEFARLLEALGQDVTDEELEIAVDIVDADRTGKISWMAFKAWWRSR